MDVSLTLPERKRPSTWSFSAKMWAVILPEPCCKCNGIAIFRKNGVAYCEKDALLEFKELPEDEVNEFWAGIVEDGLRSAGIDPR